MNDRDTYRAKRVDNGEWVYGSYNCYPEGDYTICDMNQICAPQVEVDPATRCQCTSLKDKNGRMVFEGDLIKSRYPLSQGYYFGTSAQPAIFKIKHEDACLCAYNDNGHRFFLWELKDVEIIGTIWDNPDLLGEEGGL